MLSIIREIMTINDNLFITNHLRILSMYIYIFKFEMYSIVTMFKCRCVELSCGNFSDYEVYYSTPNHN